MALLLPVLLLLVFGIIDFGRLLNAQISVTEAAREGARAATIQSSLGAAENRVNLINADYDVVTGSSKACDAAPAAGADAVVVVTYKFAWVTPVGAIAGLFGGSGFGTGLTLKGTGVMPCRA